MQLLEFDTCFEVDDERIELALAPAVSLEDELPRVRVFALLDRMTNVARPRQGAARILHVLARIAGCAWIDGDLEVTLRAFGEGTTIDLTVNDGLVRTRLRPSLELAVPLRELEVGIERTPDRVSPLAVREAVPGQHIVMTIAEGKHRSIPPKQGWGRPPVSKSTVKMEAVRIPPEAYRDPPSEKEAPTVRPPAPPTQPGVDEGSPETGEIDGDW